jgi:hypothetical protein
MSTYTVHPKHFNVDHCCLLWMCCGVKPLWSLVINDGFQLRMFHTAGIIHVLNDELTRIWKEAVVSYLRYYHSFSSRNWGNHDKCVRIIGLRAQIWSRDSPNTNRSFDFSLRNWVDMSVCPSTDLNTYTSNTDTNTQIILKPNMNSVQWVGHQFLLALNCHQRYWSWYTWCLVIGRYVIWVIDRVVK